MKINVTTVHTFVIPDNWTKEQIETIYLDGSIENFRLGHSCGGRREPIPIGSYCSCVAFETVNVEVCE